MEPQEMDSHYRWDCCRLNKHVSTGQACRTALDPTRVWTYLGESFTRWGLEAERLRPREHLSGQESPDFDPLSVVFFGGRTRPLDTLAPDCKRV